MIRALVRGRPPAREAKAAVRVGDSQFPPSGWLALGSVFCVMVVMALPLLLLGGLAVQIRRDIMLRPSIIGMAGTAYFLVAAVLSVIVDGWPSALERLEAFVLEQS